jgi:hypothetical protein
MILDETISMYCLLVANAALLAAVGLALGRYRRQLERFELFWNSPTGAALANRPAGEPPQPAAIRHLEQHVTDLREELGKIRAESADHASRGGGRWPIENALRMARHGASIDELVRSCGLNIGEAQLMRKLHGQARAESRAN